MNSCKNLHFLHNFPNRTSFSKSHCGSQASIYMYFWNIGTGIQFSKQDAIFQRLLDPRPVLGCELNISKMLSWNHMGHTGNMIIKNFIRQMCVPLENSVYFGDGDGFNSNTAVCFNSMWEPWNTFTISTLQRCFNMIFYKNDWKMYRVSSHQPSQNSLTFPWPFCGFPWPWDIFSAFHYCLNTNFASNLTNHSPKVAITK